MKVVVTGCQGQVGYCLVKQLSQRTDIEILALDRTALDISNPEQVNTLITNTKPDVIINAAAYTAVDKAESEPQQAYAINRDGPEYLALAAKEINALLLHISTDYVFDGCKTEPYLESDDTNPQTVYGQSKLAGEKKIQAAGCRYGILRTAWVFGEHGHNFVKTMLRLGDKPELNIVADQWGGPTYAGDIASTLITMMYTMTGDKSVESSIFHFSGSPHCSWFEFAGEIFATAKTTGQLESSPLLHRITTEAYPLPAPRPANCRLNCEKIHQEFGITPSNWKAALQQVLSMDIKENQA
ncbi:MAG: dTDP-4-dehydrorhamnose reductase [Shewanella sp.]|nr:dTDP-4-dehydrorhamnose reductase [Shewanella sp.]MCF1432231.1 dTDP-4-dehydrorhamnose reductase [Shewanella sp.]MCF1457169.1 dTDP-4-dehydrorhamnose reductase [Shewanella sp.]